MECLATGLKILGKEIIAVANRRIPKSEQLKGYFYTPFSIAHMFGKSEIGPCLHAKKAGTIITTKPLVVNKFKNVSISREEALMLEREYYRCQNTAVISA